MKIEYKYNQVKSNLQQKKSLVSAVTKDQHPLLT